MSVCLKGVQSHQSYSSSMVKTEGFTVKFTIIKNKEQGIQSMQFNFKYKVIIIFQKFYIFNFIFNKKYQENIRYIKNKIDSLIQYQ